ncbi:MAG TPA: hypothetical protein VF199_05365 [Bacillales bacterium]
MGPNNMPPMGVSPAHMGPNNMPPMGVSPAHMGPNNMPTMGVSPAHMGPNNMPPMGVSPTHMGPEHMKHMHDLCKKYHKQKVVINTVHGDQFNAYIDDFDAENVYVIIGDGHDYGDERDHDYDDDSRVWGGYGWGGWPGYGPHYGYGWGGYGRFILPLIFLAGISAGW